MLLLVEILPDILYLSVALQVLNSFWDAECVLKNLLLTIPRESQ
jgi:hypothetical protein